MFTKRHAISTISDYIGARTEFAYYMRGVKKYRVWLYNKSSNAYIFDGVYSKDELLEMANA